MTLSGTVQLAAAHCPNEWALDPQSAARQTHLFPSQTHCAMCSDIDSQFFSSEY